MRNRVVRLQYKTLRNCMCFLHARFDTEAMNGRTSCARIALLALLLATTSAKAAVTVGGPTTDFRPVPLGSTTQNDYYFDRQTGQDGSDIVGDTVGVSGANPGFYTAYDGTYVYYRVRFGLFETKGDYTGLFWVGIDGNNDYTVDLFVGVNNQGGGIGKIQFNAPGDGANTSPNTTTVDAKNVASFNQVVNENYHYAPVTATLQPGALDWDLRADRPDNVEAHRDAFLTFRVPFSSSVGPASLQAAMLAYGKIDITPATPLAYVIATATQGNTLNQDIGGINGGLNITTTFRDLGAISPLLNLDGTPYEPPVVVPEPGTWFLMAASLALLAVAKCCTLTAAARRTPCGAAPRSSSSAQPRRDTYR